MVALLGGCNNENDEAIYKGFKKWSSVAPAKRPAMRTWLDQQPQYRDMT